MACRIEDYALVSDMRTGALVGRTGSIDWLCLPRYDSPSVFGALLGTEDNGRWLLAPADADAVVVDRRYEQCTFTIRTHWRTATGEVLITELMPIAERRSSLVRRVEGLSGTVRMVQDLRFRFGYGKVLPWVRRIEDDGGRGIVAMAGPDALVLRGMQLPHASNHAHSNEFTVTAGDREDLELIWFPSHRPIPGPADVDKAVADTNAHWQNWSAGCVPRGMYDDAVKRSMLVLRAMTHAATGGIVAALTTSLPEEFGGSRNWDYRFCWLRDAALTLEAMLTHGYQAEAMHWRNWLLRAVAGDPHDLQIMYGVAGERELPERILAHLPGYEGSHPVRIGNGAVSQYQGDVVGEVMVALEKLRTMGGHEDQWSWPLQRSMLHFVENNLQRRDQGLWEMRGKAKFFTHSRVMMWAALDRGARAVRDYGLEGPVERWEKLRDALRDEIMEHGVNRQLNSFTQAYDGCEVDASLLQLPQVGFIPYDHELMEGTVSRIEQDLVDDAGFVLRYRTHAVDDGLQPGENPFLACSFWLVEQYAHTGRLDDAHRLMDRLIGCSTDLGLLSEEYDTAQDRMAGNYPQAFSHLALVRAADALHSVRGVAAAESVAG